MGMITELLKNPEVRGMMSKSRGDGKLESGLIKNLPEEYKVMKSGGKVSASSRADGIATKGKTRGKIV